MQSVESERFFPHPQASVFALLADHTRFFAGHGMRCEIVQATPDGVGTQREVQVEGVSVREIITMMAFPDVIEYRVEKCWTMFALPIPFRHHLGQLRFVPRMGGTLVQWRSVFEIPLPLVGRFLEQLMAWRVHRIFARLLLRAQKLL
jgi:hypothetical protein